MQLDLDLPDLPPFRIRASRRAKNPSVSVCVHRGMTITVPDGYSERRTRRLLDEWRPWIDEQLRKLAEHQASMPAERRAALPERIELPAVQQAWDLIYVSDNQRSCRVKANPSQLIVSGPLDNHQAVRAALRRWLARQARAALVPWLADLSSAHGLTYARVTIRGQRTRWGSYTSNRTLNLNYLLMFLERDLVRCVLLHELCHARYLSHGPRFYGLLSRLEPNYAELDRRINDAWQLLPTWAVRD